MAEELEEADRHLNRRMQAFQSPTGGYFTPTMHSVAYMCLHASAMHSTMVLRAMHQQPLCRAVAMLLRALAFQLRMAIQQHIQRSQPCSSSPLLQEVISFPVQDKCLDADSADTEWRCILADAYVHGMQFD